MTKEQERAALKQIESIILSAGTDSYIAAAFDGCVQDAEENIDNDWCCSWKQRAETEAHIAEDADRAARAAVQKAANESLRADIAEEEAAKQKSRAEALQQKLDAEKEERQRAQSDYRTVKADAGAAAMAAEETIKELRQQIIELKARLYDFMTQG